MSRSLHNELSDVPFADGGIPSADSRLTFVEGASKYRHSLSRCCAATDQPAIGRADESLSCGGVAGGGESSVSILRTILSYPWFSSIFSVCRSIASWPGCDVQFSYVYPSLGGGSAHANPEEVAVAVQVWFCLHILIVY
jgi:hypothetical protein